MKTIGVACVGTGYWGKNLVRSFHDLKGCTLRVCCDLNEDILQNVAAQYPNLATTRDYTQVLQDPGIDAVVLASPATMHFPMAREALEAGKHVFVEKPLALRVVDADVLCRTADMHGLVLMVGHLLEYHPAIRELKQFVDGGFLGEVNYIYTQRVNFGIIRKNETALWSLGPHDVSVVCYLLNREPNSVNACGESYVQEGIEDVVFCNLHFSNRVMAQIHVSWLDPHKIRRLTIVGSQRMAVFDDMEPVEKIRIYNNYVERTEIPVWEQTTPFHRGAVVVPEVQSVEPLRLECEHFLNCVQRGERPCSDGRDGLRVVRVLDAAQRSLESGGLPIQL